MTIYLLAAFLLVLFSGYILGQSKARSIARTQGRLHSLPSYCGGYVAIWCGVPLVLVLLLWWVGEPAVLKSLVLDSFGERIQEMPPERLGMLYAEVRNTASGISGFQSSDPEVLEAAKAYQHYAQGSQWIQGVVFALVALGGIAFGWGRIRREFRARQSVERAFNVFLVLSSLIAVLTTVGIVCSLVFESIRFFELVPVHEFLFGLKWYPQIAIREDQAASAGAFGAIPVFGGTLLISFVALCVAGPIGLFSAIYFAEYADRRVRAVIKPALEILAGIPTVVYGFFAALTVAPLVREFGINLGFETSAQSALAAGLVMGVMIIPFVSSLSDDVINAVPQTLRDGSLAMGATQSETIKQVVLPAALPGIVGAFLLAISRAIGETMIVVMAAGLNAKLTLNPLENVTTVTVQMVVSLIGDQEFDDPKTLSAFALGLLLFFVTLGLNVIALQIVKRYREKYD